MEQKELERILSDLQSTFSRIARNRISKCDEADEVVQEAMLALVAKIRSEDLDTQMLISVGKRLLDMRIRQHFRSRIHTSLDESVDIPDDSVDISRGFDVLVDEDVDTNLLAAFLCELATLYAELSAGDELIIQQGTSVGDAAKVGP